MPLPTIIASMIAEAGGAPEAESFAAQLSAGAAAMGLAGEGAPEGPDHIDVTIPVDSSAINAIGYKGDENEGNITVVFKRGGSISYDYPGTLAEFTAFALAPSKGEFFNAHLKDR